MQREIERHIQKARQGGTKQAEITDADEDADGHIEKHRDTKVRQIGTRAYTELQ